MSYNKAKLFLTTLGVIVLLMAIWTATLIGDKKAIQTDLSKSVEYNKQVTSDRDSLNDQLWNVNNSLEKTSSEIEKLKEDMKKLEDENSKLKAENERLTSMGQPTKTAPSVSSSVSRGGSVVRVINMESSAYTASCKGCSGVTTTGLNLLSNPQLKVIAVDPRIIPLGTKVYVEGYGTAVAADTGGAIKGNKIDIFIPSRQDALDWGRKVVKVSILN